MDYLTRLIQRAARTSPAVQPLLRPRYAPEDGEALPPDESAAETWTEWPPPASGLSSFPAPTVELGSERFARADDVRQGKAAPGVERGADRERMPPSLIQDEEVPAQRAPQTPPAPGHAVPWAPPVPALTEGSQERPPLASAMSAVPGEPAHRATGSRGDAPGEADGLLLPGRVVEGPEVPASVIEPRREAPPAAGEAAKEFSPPVVQVTIGRIDVRAVPPAPRPLERSGPAAPRLDLDAYLRNGGRG